MGDETKDTSPNKGDEPSDIKQSAKDQSDKSQPAGTVGADVPEKAKPLPPEAGSLSPARQIEAKTKAEQPSGETLKTEAKGREESERYAPRIQLSANENLRTEGIPDPDLFRTLRDYDGSNGHLHRRTMASEAGSRKSRSTLFRNRALGTAEND